MRLRLFYYWELTVYAAVIRPVGSEYIYCDLLYSYQVITKSLRYGYNAYTTIHNDRSNCCPGSLMLAQYCFDALTQAWPNVAMPWVMATRVMLRPSGGLFS